MSRRAAPALLALLVLFAGPARGGTAQNLDGLTIVSITFDRFQIFDTTDPKTSLFFHHWANALHIVSKEEFLRSMLLFEEGDPYSESAAAESARILRSLGIVNPVEIVARPIEGGVEVSVETHDRWSLQLGGQVGVHGSRSDIALDIEENNFLGWGKSVGVAWQSDEERSAWSYRYFDPNIFKSRWQLTLDHADLSDGSRSELRVDRPFYSLATAWTWGVEARREELVEHLYVGSESAVEGARDIEHMRIWGGARLPGNGHITRRLVGSWTHREESYDEWRWESDGNPYPAPEDMLIAGPSLAYEQISNRFIVVEGFRAWTVQEDVAMGPNFAASVQLSGPGTGGDRRRVLYTLGAHGARRTNRWLFVADAWLSGRSEAEGARNVVAGFQIGGAQLGPTGFQMRVLAETSHELDLDRQLTLGADIGLRGWDPDYFDGTGRALVNVQWRKLLKQDVLGLFSVGFIVFGDAGITWEPRVGHDTEGIRVDAGFGLLFDLSHLSRTNLLRLDVAFPDDGSGPTLTISTRTIFRLRRDRPY